MKVGVAVYSLAHHSIVASYIAIANMLIVPAGPAHRRISASSGV